MIKYCLKSFLFSLSVLRTWILENGAFWTFLDSKVKKTTKSRKQVRKLHLTLSHLKCWRRYLMIQEVENIIFDALVNIWWYYTRRRQVLLEVGRLVQNIQETAQKWFERDDARRLNYARRNPNDGELMASELITWRRHLCKSIYSFGIFIHKSVTLCNIRDINPSPNFTVF